MLPNKHNGSTLDSLLEELGELEEVNAMAAKKVSKEMKLDEAKQVLSDDYFDSIKARAEDITNEFTRKAKAGENITPSMVSDYLGEVADGSYWTIYTHANYQALVCSGYEPWDEMKEFGFNFEKNPSPMPVAAFLCVKHDLEEEIGDIDAFIAALTD